jgi:hypothetical protein
VLVSAQTWRLRVSFHVDGGSTTYLGAAGAVSAVPTSVLLVDTPEPVQQLVAQSVQPCGVVVARVKPGKYLFRN